MKNTNSLEDEQQGAPRGGIPPRVRSVDWGGASPSAPPQVGHEWQPLRDHRPRELGQTELLDLRDTYTAKLNAAAWTGGCAVALLAFGIMGLVHDWEMTTWMCLGLAPLIGWAALRYAREAGALLCDLRLARVEVLKAAMPLREDGTPAARVEVESGGRRVHMETSGVDGTLWVELLPASGRVWTVDGQRLP